MCLFPFHLQYFLWYGTKYYYSTWLTCTSSSAWTDGHSLFIAWWWKWMTVIIDQSRGWMTGSSDDGCERRRQVDGGVWFLLPPLLITAWALSITSCQGSKQGNLCFRHSISHSAPPRVAVSFHQVLVAATIRKKQNIKNRISAPIVQETHCVDSRHFSCERLKSSGRNLQWDSERSRRGQQRSQMK